MGKKVLHKNLTLIKSKTKEIVELDYESLLDFVNLSSGLFYPLKGFMDSSNFYSVVEKMCLKNGEIFTLPITLSIDKDDYKKYLKSNYIAAYYNGEEIGYIKLNDIYKVRARDFEKVFKTKDVNHPGLRKQLSKSKILIGGETVLTNQKIIDRVDILTPDKTLKIFKNKGWKTIVGFQTRNVIHRAHEHLQRVGLELCDGLFINPLVGWKKKGDFTEEAIRKGYSIMINNYYPKERVVFSVLRVAMRYAGPREAVFHSLIRRNLGCTHFIIGRDHAGVGDYYGKYEAHELAKELLKKHDLGISLLLLHEPYFCKKCGSTVSEKHCIHNSKDIVSISGTNVRKSLSQRMPPSRFMMRPQVAKELLRLSHIFIE